MVKQPYAKKLSGICQPFCHFQVRSARSSKTAWMIMQEYDIYCLMFHGFHEYFPRRYQRGINCSL